MLVGFLLAAIVGGVAPGAGRARLTYERLGARHTTDLTLAAG